MDNNNERVAHILGYADEIKREETKEEETVTTDEEKAAKKVVKNGK